MRKAQKQVKRGFSGAEGSGPQMEWGPSRKVVLVLSELRQRGQVRIDILTKSA